MPTMQALKNFSELTEHLKNNGVRKRVSVVCADDPETEYAVCRALREGFADFIMVGDRTRLEAYPDLAEFTGRIEIIDIKDPDEAARHAVALAREGKADVIMKGIINTDNLLRAILNKETGILPKGSVLTHITAGEIPGYHKLLFFSDVAVIPYPTLEQRKSIIEYGISTLRRFGISQPKVALIHFTEKVNPKFPNSVDYQELVCLSKEGAFGEAILAGPMDVKTACDLHSAKVKHIESPVCGDADLLIFPNIESGNTFYKTVTLFAKAEVAGMLQGPKVPVVLPSRSDSGMSKYNSLAMAILTA